MTTPPNNSGPPFYWGNPGQPAPPNVGYYQIPPPNFPPSNLSQPPPLYNLPPPPVENKPPTNLPYSVCGANNYQSYQSSSGNYEAPGNPGYNYNWNVAQSYQSKTAWNQSGSYSWSSRQESLNATTWNEAGSSQSQIEGKGDFRSYVQPPKRSGFGNSWKGSESRTTHEVRRRAPERRRSRSADRASRRSHIGFDRQRRDHDKEKVRGRKSGPENERSRTGREYNSRCSSRASVDSERSSITSRSRKRSRSRESAGVLTASGSTSNTAKQKALTERDQLLEKYRYSTVPHFCVRRSNCFISMADGITARLVKT